MAQIYVTTFRTTINFTPMSGPHPFPSVELGLWAKFYVKYRDRIIKYDGWVLG